MAVTIGEKENCTRKFNGNIPALSLAGDEMSTSTDSDEATDPSYEIKNIRSIINVTRENIDALNAKFAGFPRPPSMYVAEYRELTAKLHSLESALKELQRAGSPEHDGRPSRVFLRAHLPNQQRTSVQIKPGLTLRDALSKALKLRNLTCEMCEVLRPEGGQALPWDMDISSIDTEEVSRTEYFTHDCIVSKQEIP